jgi:hypothetical protein
MFIVKPRPARSPVLEKEVEDVSAMLFPALDLFLRAPAHSISVGGMQSAQR